MRYPPSGDNTVLGCSRPPEEDLQPILRVEVETAVALHKKGKSAGVDNIPADIVQAGGETMIDVLTMICDRIWRIEEWPRWTQSLIITLPKRASYSSARTTELSASSVIRAKSCCKSSLIGLNPKLKNRLGSEPEEAHRTDLQP